nr:hypothetical protein BaRGS_013288 [Batillaria attramentaria]
MGVEQPEAKVFKLFQHRKSASHLFLIIASVEMKLHKELSNFEELSLETGIPYHKLDLGSNPRFIAVTAVTAIIQERSR